MSDSARDSTGETDTGFPDLSPDGVRIALLYQTLDTRGQGVMARLVHAARNDQQCGRDGVSTLLDKLQAEGLCIQDDKWLERVAEELDAIYPPN